MLKDIVGFEKYYNISEVTKEKYFLKEVESI